MLEGGDSEDEGVRANIGEISSRSLDPKRSKMMVKNKELS